MFTLTLAMLAAAGGHLQAPPMGDQATIDAIIREGKDHSQVMKKLTELCTKIGPRLTGSPELAAGQKWALNEFKKMGLSNVHLDEWGEAPVGFDRGPLQTAKMVAPYALDMVFTTPCWTNGTNGIVKADAILCPDSVEAIEAAKDSLKGKWVVLPAPDPTATGGGGFGGGGGGRRGGGGGGFGSAAGAGAGGGGFGGGGGAAAGAGGGGIGGGAAAPGAAGAGASAPTQRPAAPQTDLVNALDKLPIAGIIRGSRNELCVTGGRWTGKTYENHPGVPQLTVRKSDCDQLLSCFSFNQTVTLAIGAENRWYPGPVKQYNVVADLVGTEKPDEMVIVSGHFDSWNGPGSQGATDNGTGSMTAMEAARILAKVKAKPKRTIRFILWSGEEQGIFGSTGYVKTHAAELPKVSAVLVDDGGTNYQGGYVGLATQKDIFESAFAPVVKAFPDMPEIFRVSERMPRGGGSDHAPFNAVGVPGFFTIETGRNNYTFVHHTQHDNLSQAIPEYLVQSSTNHAVVAYNLACLSGLVPRETPSAP